MLAAGFEDFFRMHYARLARALYLLTADPGEAEELAQDAMARVYEKWDRVGVMASPDGYAYRTALNLQRKRVRRLAARSRRTEEPGGTDTIAAAEARIEVVRALQMLTAEQREAVVLTDWLGLTAEEAGEVLGIEAASVRGRVHRARQFLRERFGGSDE